MQDNIPEDLIAAFERQYDVSFDHPDFRNERLAMRYGWQAAMEHKPCLVQIQEPASIQAARAAVAVPDERAAFESWWSTPHLWSNGHKEAQWNAWQARAALAATPANCDSLEQLSENNGLAPVVLPEPSRWLMRDNHTFRKLPGDNAVALSLILSEFDTGYSHSSLFARDSSGKTIDDCVHCHGKREALETEARAWLDRTSALLAGVSAPAAQAERQPWLLYLSDRADGVAGRYAIARWNPAGYREVWNLRSHRWSSFSDEVLTLEQAQELLKRVAIPTAPQAQADARDAAPAASGQDARVQWWLATLDQYGNPTLTDGAHQARAGADKAAYLIDTMNLGRGKKYAVARVELSEPKPSSDGVNHEAIAIHNRSAQAAQQGGAA